MTAYEIELPAHRAPASTPFRPLATLAKAKINVTAMDAVVSGRGRFAAIFWVKKKSIAKAARLLHAR